MYQNLTLSACLDWIVKQSDLYTKSYPKFIVAVLLIRNLRNNVINNINKYLDK